MAMERMPSGVSKGGFPTDLSSSKIGRSERCSGRYLVLFAELCGARRENITVLCDRYEQPRHEGWWVRLSDRIFEDETFRGFGGRVCSCYRNPMTVMTWPDLVMVLR